MEENQKPLESRLDEVPEAELDYVGQICNKSKGIYPARNASYRHEDKAPYEVLSIPAYLAPCY